MSSVFKAPQQGRVTVCARPPQRGAKLKMMIFQHEKSSFLVLTDAMVGVRMRVRMRLQGHDNSSPFEPAFFEYLYIYLIFEAYFIKKPSFVLCRPSVRLAPQQGRVTVCARPPQRRSKLQMMIFSSEKSSFLVLTDAMVGVRMRVRMRLQGRDNEEWSPPCRQKKSISSFLLLTFGSFFKKSIGKIDDLRNRQN